MLELNLGCQFFFPKLWLRQSLDIMVSYHAQYQKKQIIQSLENLVTYIHTYGRRDRRTSDFIGMLSNVERPKGCQR